MHRGQNPGAPALLNLWGAIPIVKALDTLKKEPLTPTKTAETLKEDKEWVQSKLS
jgi:hypothetical protein